MNANNYDQLSQRFETLSILMADPDLPDDEFYAAKSELRSIRAAMKRIEKQRQRQLMDELQGIRSGLVEVRAALAARPPHESW